MARRTRATPLTRFLVVIALMAAVFFGVNYLLSNTEAGKELHGQLLESVQE